MNRKRKIKQKILLALAFVLAFALFACGKTSEQKWQEQYDTGMRYLSELNYEEAIVAFTAAIEAEPKNTAAYLGRAEAYVAKAKASAPPSVEIKDWPEELVALYKLAENDYLAAIGIDKELAAAYLGLADLYIEQGELDKAREILEEGFDATGDAAISQKQEELPPVHNGPWTEKVTKDDGDWIYEYDENGKLIRTTWIEHLAGYTNTYIFNEDQIMVQILTEWLDPEESGIVSHLLDFSPETENRILHELTVDLYDSLETHYAYNGDTVSIRLQMTQPEPEGYFDNTLTYTLQNPDAIIQVGSHVWSSDGLEEVEIIEYDSMRNKLCTHTVYADGSIDAVLLD